MKIVFLNAILISRIKWRAPVLRSHLTSRFFGLQEICAQLREICGGSFFPLLVPRISFCVQRVAAKSGLLQIFPWAQFHLPPSLLLINKTSSHSIVRRIKIWLRAGSYLFIPQRSLKGKLCSIRQYSYFSMPFANSQCAAAWKCFLKIILLLNNCALHVYNKGPKCIYRIHIHVQVWSRGNGIHKPSSLLGVTRPSWRLIGAKGNWGRAAHSR